MKKKIVIHNPDIAKKTSKTYFLEKTSNLLYKLLVGKGDARSRLRENESSIMFILNIDVPDEFKKEQKKILKLLSKREAFEIDDKVLATSFQNSISGIRNSTASEIIKKISSLFHSVKCFGED